MPHGLLSSLLAMTLLAAAGCDRTASGPPTSPIARVHPQSVAAAALPLVTLGDQFAAVASIAPTFGGLYFDRGVLHVVLTDTTRDLKAVRQAITAVFADKRLAQLPITVDAGSYNYAQLSEWGRELPKAFAVAGVVSTDIDEERNRIAIGVVSDAVEPAVRAVLVQAGIPDDVLAFEIDEEARTLSSLGGEVRNILGGVHIDDGISGDWCTLGLNITYAGTASSLTNGHCSTNWGGSGDGSPFWQAFRSVSADSIGAEGTESALFGSSHDSRCPTTTAACVPPQLKCDSTRPHTLQWALGGVDERIERQEETAAAAVLA